MVSGAEKRRRRREAAAAARGEDPDDSSGDGEPPQAVTYEEGPPPALPSTIEAFRLRAKHLDSSVKIIAEMYKGDVSQDWEVAKERLGTAQAGETVERFVRLNIKEHAAAGKPVFATGSDNPLTLDVILVNSKLAATIKLALLADPRFGVYIQTENMAMIQRRGMWYVMAGPPAPAEGKQLESWEKVFGLTARYTSPFERPGGAGYGHPRTMISV